MKKGNNKIFNYIIIGVVLIIPFMYSFFYLKAYWNPYGEGNIDNLPVAIVNNDEGSRGNDLVSEIKESKKLKLSVVSAEVADDGLYNKDYYAVINIPSDFTSSLESSGSNVKKHATVTYSPNQKSNYLASQIINNVVSKVEINLDNKINSEIVDSLSSKIKEVPDELDSINNGFNELNSASYKLKNGSSSLVEGTESLVKNYNKFDSGVKSLQNGADKLENGAKEFNSLTSGLNDVSSAVSDLKSGSDLYTSNFSSYVTGVNSALDSTNDLVNIILNTTCVKVESGDEDITSYDIQACSIAKAMLENSSNYGGYNVINYLKYSGNTLNSSNDKLNSGINSLNDGMSSFDDIENKIKSLQDGTNNLLEGASNLKSSSKKIMNGINSLNDGANLLNNGISDLSSSVSSASDEINKGVNTTKKDVKKVEGLKEYSSEPVKVDTNAVNEVSSYGTAFSPFFISIALWVGCLMLYIILYYDKDDRFKKLSVNNTNFLKRTFYYHGLATCSGLVLGILLQLFLDFEITSVWLYYVSIVLIANMFVSIMEFLIVNFKDIGKFIALLLLVLQLAAAGGTFPIETVSSEFRWLYQFLPMTYTINLLKESLVVTESSLLTYNFIVVFGIFIVIFVINIINDIRRQRKNNT